VKTTGDGILIEFPSVVDAVACAVAIQERFNAFLGIGSAYLQKEEFEQGIDWLTRGLAERPSATWAWRFVVQGYVALGRMPEARDALAKLQLIIPAQRYRWRTNP
jgi:hypothetical protein